jgi:C4-dicarboxylate-specific signal transduction histidine kinase
MEVTEMKLPKLNKNTRYYYRHREEISAARKERLMQDPEYQAKQLAKEEAKRAKEEAKEEAKQKASEEKEAKQKAKQKLNKEDAQRIREEKRKIKAQLLGICPV